MSLSVKCSSCDATKARAHVARLPLCCHRPDAPNCWSQRPATCHLPFGSPVVEPRAGRVIRPAHDISGWDWRQLFIVRAACHPFFWLRIVATVVIIIHLRTSQLHCLSGTGYSAPVGRIRSVPCLGLDLRRAPPPPLEAGGGWALASCSMVCWRHLHASHTETLTSRLRLVPPSGLIQRYRSRRRASTRAPLFVEWQILSACSGLFGSWIRQWRALSKTTDHQQLEFLT